MRGAAKVRLRALQAITERIEGRFEVEEGKFYLIGKSAEDADRATSTNYLYQRSLIAHGGFKHEDGLSRLESSLVAFFLFCW